MHELLHRAPRSAVSRGCSYPGDRALAPLFEQRISFENNRSSRLVGSGTGRRDCRRHRDRRQSRGVRVSRLYPNQKVEYSWDGLDKFGRVMRGTVKGKVNIGYAYPAVYMTPEQRFQAFAQAAYPQTPTRINSRVKYILWQQKEISIDRIGMGNVAEGWSFSNVREISSSNPLALSDGAGSISRRHAYSIDTIGGNGSVEELYGSYYGQPIHNGTPAMERGLGLEGGGIAVDAAGNVYFSHIGPGVAGIWKIDLDGRIFQVGCGYGTTLIATMVPRHIAARQGRECCFCQQRFQSS